MNKKQKSPESAGPQEAPAMTDVPAAGNRITMIDVIAIGILFSILFFIVLAISPFTAVIMLILVLLICCYTAWRGKHKILAVAVLILVLYISACIIDESNSPSHHDLGKHAMSMANLRGIGHALMLYSSTYDDELPPRIELLVEVGFSNEKMFKNPFSKQEAQKIVDGKFAGELGYVIFLDFLEDDDGDMIMGYEKLKYALPGKVAVLKLNGEVTNMTPEELNAQLKEEGRPAAE